LPTSKILRLSLVPDFPTFRNAISESSHLPRRRFRDNISGLFYGKPLQLQISRAPRNSTFLIGRTCH
jgi:hypothetical protein